GAVLCVHDQLDVRIAPVDLAQCAGHCDLVVEIVNRRHVVMCPCRSRKHQSCRYQKSDSLTHTRFSFVFNTFSCPDSSRKRFLNLNTRTRSTPYNVEKRQKVTDKILNSAVPRFVSAPEPIGRSSSRIVGMRNS